MAGHSMAHRAVRSGRRWLRGGLGRVARAQAGVVSFQVKQVKLAQQIALASLAMQRVTVEVVADGAVRAGQRVVDRLLRVAGSASG